MNILRWLFFLISFLASGSTALLNAQTSFVNYTKFLGKQVDLVSKTEDTLKKQFEEKKMISIEDMDKGFKKFRENPEVKKRELLKNNKNIISSLYS